MKQKGIFDAIPTMFIDLASKSRRGTGYQLLWRMLQHAYDSCTQPLDCGIAELVVRKGKVGIETNAPIPASMKSAVYDGSIVMTKELILAATCKCKSGSDADNINEEISSLCVHGLPRAYLLTILIVEALAEHMLMEFFSKVTAADIATRIWSESELKSMRASVLILVAASGNVGIKDETDDDSSLYDVMQ